MLESLTETERLLLMAAAVQGLGPDNELEYANTYRVVGQVLLWQGMTAEEVDRGWRTEYIYLRHNEVYDILIRMTSQAVPGGGWRPAERPGPTLFEGGGNWGVPGDNGRPAAGARYNASRLSHIGQRLADELLEKHPQYREVYEPRRR